VGHAGFDEDPEGGIAQILAAGWRSNYSANHPHSVLGMMSPGNTNGSINPGLSHGVDR
jgi:hypothetical protein